MVFCDWLTSWTLTELSRRRVQADHIEPTTPILPDDLWGQALVDGLRWIHCTSEFLKRQTADLVDLLDALERRLVLRLMNEVAHASSI